MAIRVKLPKNVLTEIFSNWDAWSIGFLKRVLQQAAAEEQATVEEELAARLDQFFAQLESAQNAYLAGAGSEYLDLLNRLQDRLFPVFQARINRIFGIGS